MRSLFKNWFCLVLLSYFTLNAQTKTKENFYFVAYGDMPYFLPEDDSKFEKLIKTINGEDPAFTVNVGDFKSSATPCSDALYLKISGCYDQFNAPLIYVPGDNEWTDCTKKAAGAYDAEERLSLIRKMFFKDASSFGKEKLKLISQSQMPAFAKFVENNRWDFQGIAFVTLHVVGTNNNFITTSKNGNEEFYERQKANIAWLEEAFNKAKENDQRAIVIALHADMFCSDPNDAEEASGFYAIKKKLRELVVDFRRPVLLINGDSHLFKVDKPFFEDAKREKTLENFTRVQVPGEANMQAVKISVDLNSKAIFRFGELLVEY